MGREPWLAVNLSLFLPGLGQWYSGERRLGVGIALLAAALFVGGIGLCFAPGGSVVAAMILMGAAVVVALAAHVRAYRHTVATNPPEFEQERRSHKDAWLAAMLSRILPGIGQAYLGRPGPAAGFLVGLVLLALLPWISTILGSVWTAFAMLQAFHSAPTRPTARWIAHVAWGTCLVALVVGVATSVVRSTVVQAFRMPSESMLPGLRVGDYFFIRKWSVRDVRRGDVVVFPYPTDRSKDFVKRVIGLPGDTVAIQNKAVVVNGRLLTEPYAIHIDASVVPAGPGSRDNAEPFAVAAGMLYVLGDNRDNSNDSRFFGTIPLRDLKGIAYKIYWPLGRTGPVR